VQVKTCQQSPRPWWQTTSSEECFHHDVVASGTRHEHTTATSTGTETDTCTQTCTDTTTYRVALFDSCYLLLCLGQQLKNIRIFGGLVLYNFQIKQQQQQRPFNGL